MHERIAHVARGTSRRVAFTLLEVLIATGVLGTVLGAGFLLAQFGMRQALTGMAQDSALESCVTLVDRLTDDLDQILAIPGTAQRRVIAIDPDHQRIAFLVPARSTITTSLANAQIDPTRPFKILPEALDTEELIVHYTPVLYSIAPRPGGLFSPVRNGQTLGSVILSSWSIESTTGTTAIGIATDTAAGNGLMSHVTIGISARATPNATSPFDPSERPPHFLSDEAERALDARMIALVMPVTVKGLAGSGSGTAHKPSDADGARGPAAITGLTPSVSGLPHVDLSGTPSVLVIRFTAVDTQRRVKERRELRWPLRGGFLVTAYQDRYPVPDGVYRP